MPSSDQIDCTSTPSDSRSRAATAIAHGACTRPPNGVRMQMRQSPISSRKRSTTTVRSDGTTPVARSWSRRNSSRFHAARSSRPSIAGSLLREQLARELADRGAELVRPPDALALPERHRAGNAGRRRDEHAVARDLLDPPRRRAEHDHLAVARLVHHLLVELADAAAAVGDEDAEEPAVGDRARVRDREPARSLASADDAAGAVPHDARPELGELVGRVAAREHVEHVLELRARKVGERVRAAHERVQLGDLDLLVRADGDDLLREDVERVARDLRLLDRAREHPLQHDRRLEQVGAELREDAALRHRVERVAGAPDALQPARDRLRRLDLDDEIDRAHVDAELERRRRDEARDAPRLQVLLDDDALLARERPVVGARHLLFRELVQAQREPLRETPVVHEHDRRPVRAHELEHRGIDRRPDRALLRRLAHVLERDDDLQVERLRDARVDELDRAAAGDEPADLLQRALRRRQPDPLEASGEALEPFERQREVRAALRPRDGVHLVDDHRLDGAQHVARLRREHEEERLRRRDEDVGRVAEDRLALLLRRVARADGDAQLRLQSRERAAQVALDVVVQRLQR